MQRSIRKRPLVSSTLVVGLLLIVACLAVYSWVAPRIGQQFDQALLARAQALISLTRYRNGQVYMDYQRQLAAEAVVAHLQLTACIQAVLPTAWISALRSRFCVCAIPSIDSWGRACSRHG